MIVTEDYKKEIKQALTYFIGRPIHFKDQAFYDSTDNAGFIFYGLYVKETDEGVLLWDNEDRYVTLQYALENQVK